MNHDATHCADYDKQQCPKHCYRAELTEEYKQRFYELHYLPVSWCHYLGTKQCERNDNNGKE